jgi:general secretion pathway protein L
MEKRFIGIDIDRGWVRLAVAGRTKNGPALLALQKRAWSEKEGLVQVLRDLTANTRIFGDRLAAALPATSAFTRWLDYPFADPKKIAAAVRFALAGQLPTAIDHQMVIVQGLEADSRGGCRVAASAVPEVTIEAFLAPFEEAGIPLQVLDLTSFAIPRALACRTGDGLVVLLREEETVITLLQKGQTTDYRLFSGPVRGTAHQRAAWLISQGQALLAAHGLQPQPFFLIGPKADPALLEALHIRRRDADFPEWKIYDEQIPPEFMPAAALAWRATFSDQAGQGNFRRGRFALKGEWAALKKKLLTAAAVLVLTAALAVGSAWLGYAHKARRAEALQQEMKTLFSATFPEVKVLVDIPRQMSQEVGELRNRGGRLGLESSASALQVLREISLRTPKEVPVDIRELSYGTDEVRLEGSAASFDHINRLSRSLKASPLFAEARISDAKTSLDGQQVDFRLNIGFSREVQP